MQTEQPSQFQLNPQVLVAVAVCFLALGLPVAAVILFFLGWGPGAAKSEAGPDPQLTKTLEDIAAQNLAPKPLAGDGTVRLQADDPASRVIALERLARSVGGSALPATADEPTPRLWISLPQKRVPAFLEAARSGVSELEYPAANPQDVHVLIEVIVEKKSP